MIHALGRTVQSVMPDYAGPKLGVKVVEKNVGVVARPRVCKLLLVDRVAMVAPRRGCARNVRRRGRWVLTQTHS